MESSGSIPLRAGRGGVLARWWPKKAHRWLLYRLLEWSFFCFFSMLRLLPRDLFRRLSTPFLSLLISLLVPKRRILKNLGAAFGHSYSEATKRGLARGVQEHFAKNLLDCFLQLVHPGHAREVVTIKGLDNLKSALAKGKGVIALGAHMGNFVMAGARLGMEGYPFYTLFRVPTEKRMLGIIHRYLPRFHQRIIPSRPRRDAVKNILAALKRNEVVFILGDNLKKGKVPALLFGQPVLSPRGPVSLALRSEAALVPLYLVRNYKGGLHLVIEPEIAVDKSGDLAADIATNTQKIVSYLEGLIRRYPDQWNWLTVRMGIFPKSQEGLKEEETGADPRPGPPLI